jgi:hypothetical protein
VAGKPLPAAHKNNSVDPKLEFDSSADDMCMMTPAELSALKEDARNAHAKGNFKESGGILSDLVGILDNAIGEDWW